MKKVLMVFIVVYFFSGLLYSPDFVMAKDTCYVDEDGDDGDGDKDDPFEEIEDALDEGCDKIIVKKGAYKDAFTLSSSTELEGESRGDVILKGKITLKDDSELKKVTVDGGGIEVDDGADVDIKDVTIKNSRIGIETTGRGNLTVDDCAIYDNGKGFYIQTGKDIKITDTEVRDNDEEGIDIRANVDGEISDNTIEDNGESGIEVILGKSELRIDDNKIKDNGSSGIAMQYYKSTSKVGAVKVVNNTISDNKDFGINCKAPSGGNPGKDYWSTSTNMTSNKVTDNKDGNFSDTCFFSDDEVTGATMTKEEKEEQERLAQEALRQQQLEQEKEQIAQEKAAEAEEQAQKEREEQERLRERLQKDKDLQNQANGSLQELGDLRNENYAALEKINERSAFVTFLIGPRYKEVGQIDSSLTLYEEKIASARALQEQIEDQAIKESVRGEIDKITQEQQELEQFISNKKNEFSLFGWIFDRNSD